MKKFLFFYAGDFNHSFRAIFEGETLADANAAYEGWLKGVDKLGYPNWHTAFGDDVYGWCEAVEITASNFTELFPPHEGWLNLDSYFEFYQWRDDVEDESGWSWDTAITLDSEGKIVLATEKGGDWTQRLPNWHYGRKEKISWAEAAKMLQK